MESILNRYLLTTFTWSQATENISSRVCSYIITLVAPITGSGIQNIAEFNESIGCGDSLQNNSKRKRYEDEADRPAIEFYAGSHFLWHISQPTTEQNFTNFVYKLTRC